MSRTRVRIGILSGLLLVASLLVGQITPSAAGYDAGDFCLALTEPIQLGDVTTADWDTWTGLDVDFGSSKEHLSVRDVGGPQSLVLRQQLVPTSRGSDRVTMEASIAPARTYQITQRVYFEPNFDWGRDSQGGKLGFGLGGGTTPTGGDLDPNGFSARFMWRGNGDGSARIVVYSYAADRTQNLPYGDDYDLVGFEAPIGQWFTLTMQVTTNSSIGSSNGSVRAWVNGDLALERNGIRWQAGGGTPMVDHLLYATFHGGSGWNWAPNRTNHVRFDDVCWGSIGSTNPPMPSRGGPRGGFTTVRSDLASLVPSGSGQIDYRINAALDQLDGALEPSNWLTNWSLTDTSDTMTRIDRAVSKLRSAGESSDASPALRSDLASYQATLARDAQALANGAVKKTRTELERLGCSCVTSRRLLAVASSELTAARRSVDTEDRADHARRAWDRAQRALVVLPDGP